MNQINDNTKKIQIILYKPTLLKKILIKVKKPNLLQQQKNPNKHK